MSIMLGKLYTALRAGQGISEEDARAAAEEVAGYDSRLAATESRLLLVQWMVGTNLALTVGLLGMVFTLMGRVP